jgi:arylformamidase
MSKPVWLDLDQAALDAAYDQRVWAPDAADWIARYAADTAAARAAHSPRTEDYGGGLLDLYRPAGAPRGLHLHVHGGAWRSLTRGDAGLCAPGLLAAGFEVAVPDFRLLPEHRIPDQLADVLAACAWAARRAQALGVRLHLSGHSSGAHVAACAALDASVAPHLASLTLVSGMYDLTPVMLSARSAYVQLSPEEVAALSPIRRAGAFPRATLVAVGERESPEFLRQARDFAAAIGGEAMILPDTHHFAAAYALGAGALHQAMLSLA